MKRKLKNIILLSVFGALLTIYSCSKDYLDTTPTESIATPTVFETTEAAQLAINGICKLMTRQFQGNDFGQGFNGEGTIKMWYGNYPGNHFTVNLPGWAGIINGTFRENVTSKYLFYPWYYYYMIIGNANSIILNIDDARGLESEKQFIKAQALTFRAYAYTMLSQLYCKRWKDSNNGVSEGLVLRLDTSTDGLPLSSLKEVYEQIYLDLDDAIELYNQSGKSRRFNYEPDRSVAYAVYARAAITKEDYPKALQMAQSARANYPLMSNNEYKSGFYTPNREWIWSSYGASDETLYFFSYFAYIAYNSSASNVRTFPKGINRELFESIPSSDIRKSLFLDPTGYEYDNNTGEAKSALTSRARALFPDLFSTAKVYAYMQFKIKAEDLPGVGHLNHFRSSEMYLIEAEANYFMNKTTDAQNSLIALNRSSGRDPEYNCNLTGIELLNEIKRYRAIELWGEGFDWFDYKRWGDSIERKSFAQGGSFISALAVTYGPSEGNNWVWKIPAKEYEYNDQL